MVSASFTARATPVPAASAATIPHASVAVEYPRSTAIGAAPRSFAWSADSNTTAPPPSPSTVPQRRTSNGRQGHSSSSLRMPASRKVETNLLVKRRFAAARHCHVEPPAGDHQECLPDRDGGGDRSRREVEDRAADAALLREHGPRRARHVPDEPPYSPRTICGPVPGFVQQVAHGADRANPR